MEVDISITNPTAKRWIQSSVFNTRGGPAAAVERLKEEKHKARVNERGYRFLPFVLETHGAWGSQAHQFLRHLAYLRYPDETPLAPKLRAAFRRTWTQLISLSLVRGLNQGFHKALTRALPTSVPREPPMVPFLDAAAYSQYSLATRDLPPIPR